MLRGAGMRAPIIDALLVILVLGAWFGCAGFVRLRAPLDRLHCVTFVNTVCGLALAVTAFVADGVSDRALKVLLIAGLSLLAGAAATHATGRAWLLRQAASDASPDAPPDTSPGAVRDAEA